MGVHDDRQAGHAGAQGNKPRCKTCNHVRGPRGLGRLAKHDKRGTMNTKKASCGCECHSGSKSAI